MGEKMVDMVSRIMQEPNQIRNIAICAHIDHGKTTFSDNLLAGAGMMSEDLAGRTFCSYVHELHERQARSATEPFTYEFAEQEPFRVKVRMERTFCPAIDDFANYVLVLNTVNRSSR